jgi:hypothetical protein
MAKDTSLWSHDGCAKCSGALEEWPEIADDTSGAEAVVDHEPSSAVTEAGGKSADAS